MLAAWSVVAGKGTLSALKGHCTSPAPYTHPCPPASPGEEQPGAGPLVQLRGRPVAVNPEDVVVVARESPRPWEQ